MKYQIPPNFFITGVLILLLLGTLSCRTQAEKDSAYIIHGEAGKLLEEKFTPFCQDIMTDFKLPGLAVGIVKNNEIVYARGFGYHDITSDEPVSMTSIFHMASISKPFVATAIMQLVEKGKMNLDSAVVTYLPYFKLQGEQYDQITIRQMLVHISGMPDVLDYQWDNPVYDAGALERYVRSISGEELMSSPGEQFAYSNMSFECLGDVIAKVSGKSFADYVKLNILEPSGMKESTFLMPESLPDSWAVPHLSDSVLEPWSGYPYNRMHGPSSTLHSNALEMCNWALINMNRGSFMDGKILESSSYDLLWKPWFITGDESSVGLSWFLGEYKGENTVSHAGGDTGFSTNLVLLPEKSIAVIVLCNLTSSPVFEVTNAALDILLD